MNRPSVTALIAKIPSDGIIWIASVATGGWSAEEMYLARRMAERGLIILQRRKRPGFYNIAVIAK